MKEFMHSTTQKALLDGAVNMLREEVKGEVFPYRTRRMLHGYLEAACGIHGRFSAIVLRDWFNSFATADDLSDHAAVLVLAAAMVRTK